MSLLVPGYPTFTTFEGAQAPAIVPASAQINVGLTGDPDPAGGDVIIARLWLDGAPVTGYDVPTTIGTDNTTTSCAAIVASNLQDAFSGPWPGFININDVNNNGPVVTCPLNDPTLFGRVGIQFIVQPTDASTLAATSVGPVYAIPTDGSIIVSFTPNVTFALDFGGGATTFYAGRTVEVPVAVAMEALALGVAAGEN